MEDASWLRRSEEVDPYEVVADALELAARRGEQLGVADVHRLRGRLAADDAPSAEIAERLVLEVGLTPDEIGANIETYRAQFSELRRILRERATRPPAVRGEGAITLGARLLSDRGPANVPLEDGAARVLAEIFAARDLDRLRALTERRQRLSAALDLATSMVLTTRSGAPVVQLSAEDRRLAAVIGTGATLERNLAAARGNVEDALNERHPAHRRPVRRDAHRFAPYRGKKAYYLGALLALLALPTAATLRGELATIVEKLGPSENRQGEARRRELRNRDQRLDAHDGRFPEIVRRARVLVASPPAALVARARIARADDDARAQLARGLDHMLTWLSTRRGAPLPAPLERQRAKDELKAGLRRLGEVVVAWAARGLAEALPRHHADLAYFVQVSEHFEPPDTDQSRPR